MAPTNPWIETAPENRTKSVLVELEAAIRSVERIAASVPAMKDAGQTFAGELRELQAHLKKSPDDWRKVRPLLVVEIPAILRALTGVAEMKNPTKDNELVQATIAAMSGVDTKVAHMQKAREQDLILDLETARKTPLSKKPEAALRESLLGGFGQRLQKAASDVSTAASTSCEEAGSLGLDISRRAGLAASGVAGLSGDYLGSLGRAAIDPVTRRAQALSDSVLDVGVTALVFGGLASLIFPPIAPLIAGEALLSMPSSYRRKLAALSEKDARAELERHNLREDRIAAILQAIKGGPIRFDTDHLAITMNPTDGSRSGVILSGRFTGELLEDMAPSDVRLLLTHAPDEETRRALTAWIGEKPAQKAAPAKPAKSSVETTGENILDTAWDMAALFL